jgi:putative phage-type endonuclease
MKIEHCVQGTQAWWDCRNGRVTASRVKDVMSYLKPKSWAEREAGIRRESQKRIDYKTELIAEMLLGQAIPHYVNDAMKWGIEMEALAATEYELGTDEDVSNVGFVYHPSIDRAGASPDRLVGKHGLLEVKCPETTTHIEWILAGVVPEQHKAQMYFQMRCCERQWADFMSFDPRLPKRYQKFIVRLKAHKERMDRIDEEVLLFLSEVDGIIAKLDRAMPAQKQEPTEDDALGITDADIDAIEAEFRNQ